MLTSFFDQSEGSIFQFHTFYPFLANLAHFGEPYLGNGNFHGLAEDTSAEEMSWRFFPEIFGQIERRRKTPLKNILITLKFGTTLPLKKIWESNTTNLATLRYA